MRHSAMKEDGVWWAPVSVERTRAIVDAVEHLRAPSRRNVEHPMSTDVTPIVLDVDPGDDRVGGS